MLLAALHSSQYGILYLGSTYIIQHHAAVVQIDGARSLQSTLEAADKALVPLEGNLVDRVWEGRPQPPHAKLRVHALEHAGESCQDKQQRIWGECKQAAPGGGSPLCAVTMLQAECRDVFLAC